MSGWIVALGLAAGYLINKNVTIKNQLHESVEKFQSGARPATGGVTSAEVRTAHKRTDHVKYGDMNTDLPREQMDSLHSAQMAAASQAEQFDAGPSPPQIQGVMLHYDRLGA